MRTWHSFLSLLLLVMWVVDSRADEKALEVFQQRIMPIFRSPDPSSCIQCHLASVDLKDYIRPSHEETFLSLRDQGLIDLQRPKQSKILNLIGMGEQDPDAMAKRIHAAQREAELEAFSAWLEACCRDPELVARPALDPTAIAKPKLSDAVLRHARKDRVLDSFIRNVWSQRMRCFPCHTPDEIDDSNPQHKQARKRHRELVKEYGARMNLFSGSPMQSMRSLIANAQHPSDDRLPVINLKSPQQSLLILKPTSKLPPRNAEGDFEAPSMVEPVSHMGGLKMHVDDISYKAMLRWIQDLAKVTEQQYRSDTDLPANQWYPTEQVLRMSEFPAAWDAGTPVQVFVHRQSADGEQNRWETEPIAFTQGVLTPKRFVNGKLVQLKTGDSGLQAELAPGTYLLKVYVDTDGSLDREPTALLGSNNLIGEIEHTARWQTGFKNAEIVSAAAL